MVIYQYISKLQTRTSRKTTSRTILLKKNTFSTVFVCHRNAPHALHPHSLLSLEANSIFKYFNKKSLHFHAFGSVFFHAPPGLLLPLIGYVSFTTCPPLPPPPAPRPSFRVLSRVDDNDLIESFGFIRHYLAWRTYIMMKHGSSPTLIFSNENE